MNDVDRDWADIIGTALVVAGAAAAILSVILGFFWLADREDERQAAERLVCVQNGWLWADDRCLPFELVGGVIGTGVEDTIPDSQR